MLFDLQTLINKYNLNIKGAIHIGAHHGQEVDTYINNNIKNIICFEPVSSSFSQLFKLQQNKCDLFQLALGNANTKIKINLASNEESSSILIPKIHIDQHPHITFDNEEIVQMVKLDDFMTFYKSNGNNKTKKFNFINIDVQGYELEVFKGAEKTLNEIDYINAEVNNDILYENCVLISELDTYLSKYKFIRVETNWQGGTWGDALYIK